jgi:rubrerythrin
MYIYEGMTQEEIAKKFGVSQKVIWRHMRNYGIKTRVAAKRDQRGSRNHMWKGKEASYKAFHQRLKENRGEARSYGCSVCGTTSKDESYDWANLTGDYSNLNDFAPMCRKCHRQYDMARKKVA